MEILNEGLYMFVKRTQKYGDKRVRLDRPYYFTGTIFTMTVTEPFDKAKGVKGWTFDDLRYGHAARRFFPYARLNGTKDEANAICEWMNNIAVAGITTINRWKLHLMQNPYDYPTITPPLIEWNGQHRGRTVTIDGVEVETHNWAWGPATGPRAYGNLAWAWMTHIDTDFRKRHVEHRVLVDLETLRPSHPYPDGSRDWFVDTVHHVDGGTVFSEGIQCLDCITRWESPQAAEYVARRTQQK